MAFDTARSGVAHSGNFYSGDFVPSWSVYIDAVDRTRQTLSDDTTITDNQGSEPNTMSGAARGFDVVELDEIRVYNGGDGVGVPYFAGHIQQISPTSLRKVDKTRQPFTATDYTWLMDQHARVTGVYKSIGVNTLVRRILADFTEGGFTGGYLPSSLGDIDEMQFTDELVSRALDRIADRVSVGALWSVDYAKVVSMWLASEEDPHVTGGATLTVVDGDGHRDPKPSIDASQLKTRVICEGKGSQNEGLVAANAVTIPVKECGGYRASGGTVRAEQNLITYTGRSAESGPGALTGCVWSGSQRDIPDSTDIVIRAQADDAAAQTALAALIGGTGIAVDVIGDGRLGVDECEKRAASELVFYKNIVQQFSYNIDDDIKTVAGRNVAITVTKPRAITAVTLRIQQVELRKRSKVAGSTIGIERTVTAAPVRVKLDDLLSQVAV